MQAEKETGPIRAEEKVGSWFSNPAAAPEAQPAQRGVGKYITGSRPQGDVVGLTDSNRRLESLPVQPNKKQKQMVYGNFDAW